MNIGFFLIPYQRYSGAGQYYHHLFSELLKTDDKNDYIIFLPSDIDRSAIDYFGEKRCVITDIPSKPGTLRYLHTMMSRCVEKHSPRISLLHCFNFPIPIFSGKIILTMYDLRESDLPQVYDPVHTFFSSMIKPKTLKRVEHIITISDFSAQRIKYHFPLCSSKVSRIYLGFDSPENVSRERPHQRPYILTVGHLTKHKNHETLIQAFNLLSRKADFKHDLIIVGHHYNNYKYLETLKNFVECKDRVVFAGQVSEEQNETFYTHADLFVFPSLYEGFGLPLLEAFHHKIPVVASRIPTFQELYGLEKALFIPLNAADCAHVIELILYNKEIKRDMIRLGQEIAEKFSWNKTARETLVLYRRLLNQ